MITLLRGLALGALAALAIQPTAAQEKFGDKPVEVVIHAKYGGGTDTTARMMINGTQPLLDVDMAVLSKRAGAGIEAQDYVMSQPADGHTILALTQTHLYTMAQGKSQMSIDDLVGVARAMDDPTFITVQQDSAYQTIEDLVAASKERPLNWGVGEIGSTEHVGLIRFARAAGIRFKVVPFGSGAQMVQALMSGAIDATLPNVSEALSQVQDGTFRALVVMAPERLKDFPDVPTSFEKEIPVKLSTTRGYGVRADTPPEVVKMLSDAMVKGMHDPTFVKYLRSSGLDPETSIAGSEEWTAQLREEYEAAAEVLAELGVKQ